MLFHFLLNKYFNKFSGCWRSWPEWSIKILLLLKIKNFAKSIKFIFKEHSISMFINFASLISSNFRCNQSVWCKHLYAFENSIKSCIYVIGVSIVWGSKALKFDVTSEKLIFIILWKCKKKRVHFIKLFLSTVLDAITENICIELCFIPRTTFTWDSQLYSFYFWIWCGK